ncbi:MAG: hypothetical protein AAF431_16390 [Pseudomonadota bacterium]
MNLSVEISMYPLHEDYKVRIEEFLQQLKAGAGEAIEIRSNNMSTRLFGEFSQVTTLLNQAMHDSMQQFGKIVFVCKYLQGDARSLEGYE